jgi:hypothetical protein
MSREEEEWKRGREEERKGRSRPGRNDGVIFHTNI